MAGTAGIIGLGIMGGAMARHMVQGGFTVFGHDLSVDALERARSDGVETMASAAAVAENAGIIVVSLPSPVALMAVADAAPGRIGGVRLHPDRNEHAPDRRQGSRP